jgi:PIN domain nuclease of toxin-antitoxin system
MRFLLDTHVWLWTPASLQRIRADTRALLAAPENSLLLSAASSREIAIKYRLGKLPLPEPPARFIPPRLVRDGIEPLSVERHHAQAVADLPMHHADPFDRLLIAQARIEGLILVTAEPKLAAYVVELRLISAGPPRPWVRRLQSAARVPRL